MPDKILDLKNDLVFQKLFGNPKNSEITGHLLSLILKREIYNVDLDANKVMLGKSKNSKTGRLDKWNLREENHKDLKLTNDIELHILEIPKVKDSDMRNDELAQWLRFIANPEDEEVQKLMCENEFYKQAREELAYYSGDENFMRLVEARAGFLRDQEIEKYESKKEGYADGEISKAKQIAPKMKAKNMPIEEIAELTGLTKEEIEKL